jgi:hypothetical protein
MALLVGYVQCIFADIFQGDPFLETLSPPLFFDIAPSVNTRPPERFHHDHFIMRDLSFFVGPANSAEQSAFEKVELDILKYGHCLKFA